MTVLNHYLEIRGEIPEDVEDYLNDEGVEMETRLDGQVAYFPPQAGYKPAMLGVPEDESYGLDHSPRTFFGQEFTDLEQARGALNPGENQITASDSGQSGQEPRAAGD